MMHRSTVFATLAFLCAALVSVAAGFGAAEFLQSRTERLVAERLAAADAAWARAEVDGLTVRLSGTAPDEAARARAVAAAGEVVDPAWVSDRIEVAPAEDVAPPHYVVEFLRNTEGISAIGLVPAEPPRERIRARLAAIAGGAEAVADMMETTGDPPPEGWREAIGFALDLVAELPLAKVAAEPGLVRVTALAETAEERERLGTELAARRPEGVRLETRITAPRPVIAPFTLRFVIDERGARFDACSADSERAAERILAAARRAGLEGEADCAIGIGAPSARWAEAAELAIGALADLGGGTVTITDTDVHLTARPGTDQALFDRIARALERRMPRVFSVKAELPPPPEAAGKASTEPREFVAARAPEGLVTLTGRLRDEASHAAVLAYARGLFGVRQVNDLTRINPELPRSWHLWAMAGLEALAELHHGSVTLTPDGLGIRGAGARKDVSDRVTRILGGRLGKEVPLSIEVAYDETLDPRSRLPSPEECVSRINAILAARQITFDPGSSVIDAESQPVIDRIAEVMRECEHVRMEVGGHTDSQGRESMNLALSQARAEAVIDALLARNVITRNLVPKGYGETKPIADNATEEGRARNRRIEFRLLPEPGAEAAPPDAAEEMKRIGAKRVRPPAAGNGAQTSGGEAAGGTAAPEGGAPAAPQQRPEDAGKEAGDG